MPLLRPDPEFLVFIRHGQTDWNAQGRMQGHKDIPLNATGRGQAQRNGDRLKRFFDEEQLLADQFEFIASPLGRTRATMEIVRQAMGLGSTEFQLDDRLKEITFGQWEGSTLEELADQDQDICLRQKRKWDFVPPEGESYAMLSDRIAPWLAEVKRPSVVVAHGGVFRVIRGLLEGLEKDAIPLLDVPQDKIFVWRNSTYVWL